jgi:hypothetical protein
MALLAGLGGLGRAQSFDLAGGRVGLTSLDGLWRFNTGDDAAWAGPDFDDSKWALLRSDQDWSAQGYKNYGGMAWYRFKVTIPAGMDEVSLYLPRLRTCYEVYADWVLVGSYGKMPPNSMPYRGGGNYQVYPLPLGNGAARTVQIAVRVWHWPHWAGYYGGGPGTGGGLVGDSRLIAEQDALARASQLWSLTSRQMLALLQALAGLGALALFVLRRQDREYLWFSLTMLLSAANGWITVAANTQIWNATLLDVVADVADSCAELALIAFCVALLKPRRTPLLKVAVAALIAAPLVNLWYLMPGEWLTVWSSNLVQALLHLPFYAWLIGVVVIRSRQNSLDARMLAGPVILSVSASLFANAAWTTYTLGWQHSIESGVMLTREPFSISLVQLTNALFLLAVFGILILRFTRTRSQEERYASEVQAARSVQQYLIPDHLPATPGLTIASEYRPAREVGGDFFQVLPQAGDGSVLIVVGDVAGKGMEAGMLATMIVGAIRTAAAFTSDPGRILALLNERVQGRGLVTCQTLTIERDGSATLVNAGHLAPYLNGVELAMEGALPLGAIAGIEFPVMRFRMAEGDRLMLMTDGVAEAQNAGGELFGFERIDEMMRNSASPGALAAAAQAFGQEDDITVLSIVLTQGLQGASG